MKLTLADAKAINFSFYCYPTLWYGRFPSKNGSKLKTSTQKTDKVKKVEVLIPSGP